MPDDQMIEELFPMADAKAGCVSITVVAAKRPGEWIIRGWCPFQSPEEVRAEMVPYVGSGMCSECGRSDPEVEWTTHTYEVPHYLIYGDRNGDVLKGWGWPIGIYKFPWSGATFQGPVECLREGFVHGSWRTR